MQQGSYKNAKSCYICKEKIENKYVKDKKFRKVRYPNHTGEHREAVHSISKLNYIIPK